jgi:pimeloyl-ACP methyl ester carboxylesterase
MPGAHFSIGGSLIHYSFFGTGRELLFCFHGYGEASTSFGFLDEALARQFTIVAIDLPFHGQTEWREAGPLEPRELLTGLETLAAGLPWVGDGWSLLGYSMGGRIALQLLELAPERIRRVVLLAPDGLKVNPWYWLGTQTKAGNRLFRWSVRHPGWLFFVLRAGNFFRLVNPSVFKFTSHYIGDEKARQQLYARWTAMSAFSPGLRAIAALILRHRIPVQLFYGSYDRIIRWERGERFRRSCAPYCQLTLLTAGHQLLQPKFTEVIVNALYLPIV